MQILLKAILAPMFVVGLASSLAVSAGGAERVVWFDRPADAYGLPSPLKCWEVENPQRTHKPNPDQAWEKYALPLGNGFIGAMLYGGIAVERVQLNRQLRRLCRVCRDAAAKPLP